MNLPSKRAAKTLAALGGCLLLYLFAAGDDAAALKPVRAYPATPDHYGIIYEEVTLTTADSLSLVGWFYPAQDTTGIANNLVGRAIPVPDSLRRAPRPYSAHRALPGPTIVICDGDGGNMADLIFYAYSFMTRGFHVFTFDWRGFGGSADWPMDPDLLCCAEFLVDYEAALAHVESRPEVDPERIALMGFSTGAYLSFAMLPSHPEIAAFAGRALLTTFDDLLPILRDLDPKRAFHAPADYPPERLPLHAAPKVDAAVFLVVGEQDQRTPPWMSEKVLSALAGPMELWVVPAAGHGGGSAPEMIRYPEFFVRVSAFFSKYGKRS